jgi:hypothetical protein
MVLVRTAILFTLPARTFKPLLPLYSFLSTAVRGWCARFVHLRFSLHAAALTMPTPAAQVDYFHRMTHREEIFQPLQVSPWPRFP